NGDAEVAAVVIGRLATPLLVMMMAVTLRHRCCSAFAAKLAAAAMNTRTWRGAPSRPFRRRRVETALLQQRIDRRQPPAEGLIGFGGIAPIAGRIDELAEPPRHLRIEGVAFFLEGKESIGVEHFRPEIRV